MSTAESYDYALVNGVTKEEFARTSVKLDSDNGTLTPPDDIEKIEDILMLRRGILANDKMWVNKQICSNCGRTPTFYDIIKTAAEESHHSISLMAHTLVGNKFIVNRPREANCASCGQKLLWECTYNPPQYGCTWNPR